MGYIQYYFRLTYRYIGGIGTGYSSGTDVLRYVVHYMLRRVLLARASRVERRFRALRGRKQGVVPVVIEQKVRRRMTMQFRVYRWLQSSILVVFMVSLLLSFSNGSIQFLKEISLSSDESAATFVESLVEGSQV
jgi:hypothetical protein